MFRFLVFAVFVDTSRDYENPADYSPVILPRGVPTNQPGDRNSAAHSVKHRIEVPEQASPNAPNKNQAKRNSLAADSAAAHKFENSFDFGGSSNSSSSNQNQFGGGSSFVVANQESPRYSSGEKIKPWRCHQKGPISP